LHRLTTFIQRVDRRRRWRLLQKVWTAWLREKLARQKRLREAAGEQAGGATRAAGGQEGGATRAAVAPVLPQPQGEQEGGATRAAAGLALLQPLPSPSTSTSGRAPTATVRYSNACERRSRAPRGARVEPEAEPDKRPRTALGYAASVLGWGDAG
jgi:hypothetical protein